MKLHIYNNQNGESYEPALEGEVTWEWPRANAPGRLNFNVIKDTVINFQNGNMAVLFKDGKPVFRGYIFIKDRNKQPVIKCTAYDQLRYFKNKTTMKYHDVTVSELFKMVAEDMSLEVGTVDGAEYKQPNRIEENKEYFEILATGIQREEQAANNLCVMYDENGKLCFRSTKNMILKDRIYNHDVVSDWDYSASIDDGTYNRIRVDMVDYEAGTSTPIIGVDDARVNDWGILQYYTRSTEPRDIIESKINVLLPMLAKEVRSLKLTNVLGDVRVRGGCVIPVALNLGDMELVSMMLVEDVKHTIKGNKHVMDIDVSNKTFQPAVDPSGMFKMESQTKPNGGSTTGSAPDDTNAGKAWNYLISKGFSPAAAAGILGSLEAESGIDPKRLQNNVGPGTGIAQWENPGRWTLLEKYALERGMEPKSLEAQLAFLVYELEGGDPTTLSILNSRYGGLSAFKAATDPKWAADAFQYSFERAGIPNMSARYAAAEKYYGMWGSLGSGSAVGSGTFAWPVRGCNNITSRFGPRWGTQHLGTDISCGRYDPILAADDGKVTKITSDQWRGLYLDIDHGNGYLTRYQHLNTNSVAVAVGQLVSKGQHIAEMGNTGDSTGVHLHFEIHKNGVPVNPENFY